MAGVEGPAAVRFSISFDLLPWDFDEVEASVGGDDPLVDPSGEWDVGVDEKKPMVGKIKGTQTMRPGVVSFALGFGHWATGASDVTVDGVVVKGEKRRQKGIHANAAMWTDPTLTNTCIFDPVGGSVSFYDTKVRLEGV